MTIRDKILIIEDEPTIANFMRAILEARDYEVMIVQSGAMASTLIASHCPDLIILDLGLPDMDGMQLLKAVRQWSKVPVVVVSARSHERDKVAALDAGADDYLTKPFGTEELLARIRTALRHTRTLTANDQLANTGKFQTGDLLIDYDKHRVYVAGVDAKLTQNEYKLVALLGLHAGKVLTYDYLIKELWGPSARSDNQILRVNMANIRRKIEKNPAQPEYIFTETGIGYLARLDGGIRLVLRPFVELTLHGAGDVFTSALCGELLCGKAPMDALDSAVDFCDRCIHETVKRQPWHWYGLAFEPVLKGTRV